MRSPAHKTVEMTAVYPIFVVPNTKEVFLERHRVRRRQKSSACVNGVDVQQLSQCQSQLDDSDELKFPDEVFAPRGILLQSLYPMLMRMKLFGLYFTPDDEACIWCRRYKNRNPKKVPKCEHATGYTQATDFSRGEESKLASSKPYKVYAIISLVFMWINAFRAFTAFNGSDSFTDVLLRKLVNLCWAWMCAFYQTSTFMACQSGRLHRILRETRVSQEFADEVRKKTTRDTVFGVIAYLVNVSFYAYYIIIANDSNVNYYFAPFVTIIPVRSTAALYAVRGVCCAINLFSLSSWLLPLALNSALALVFRRQFLMLDERLQKSIDDVGHFNGSIRIFRRRHQIISRAVKRADQFVKVSNLAGFGCHMTSFILLSYVLISFPSASSITLSELISLWILNGIGLIFTTGFCIGLNIAVSEIF